MNLIKQFHSNSSGLSLSSELNTVAGLVGKQSNCIIISMYIVYKYLKNCVKNQ